MVAGSTRVMIILDYIPVGGSNTDLNVSFAALQLYCRARGFGDSGARFISSYRCEILCSRALLLLVINPVHTL